MIARKIAEIMIAQNDNERNYRSAVILMRLKQVVVTVLKYSDSPVNTLKDLGICFEKNYFHAKIPQFSKILYLPQRIVIENMQKEGFAEIQKRQPDQNPPEWRIFSLPENSDGIALAALFNNTKFAIESQYAAALKDRKEPIVNHQAPMMDNKKTSIKLLSTFTFTTVFNKLSSLTPRETGTEFAYLDPISMNPGAPTLPKIDRTANPNTVFIVDPASTWMSTLEVKMGQDMFLPQLIQPPTDD